MLKYFHILFCFSFFFCSCTKHMEKEAGSANLSAENIAIKPSFQKIDFTNSKDLLVFGDSWSDYDFYTNNFIRMFTDSSKLHTTNTASIGLGSANMVAQAFLKMDSTHNNTNVITLSGFNDIRFAGATTEELNFQRN